MKLTYWMILLFFAIFIVQVFYSGVTDEYAFSSLSLFARPWTLITSVFMHANLLHLLSNVFVFFFFGIAVEEERGKWKMSGLFMAGGLLGNFASMLVYPAGVMFLGASAGIFALVGAGMLIRPLDWSVAPFFLPMPLIFLGIIYAVINVYSFATGAEEGISYAGHLGGLAIGLIYGFKATGFRKGAKTIILGTIALIILIITVPVVLKMAGVI